MKNDFTIGEKIFHPKYGRGEVIDLPYNGYYVKVQFADCAKEFMPANLRLVIKTLPVIQ